MQLYIIWHHKSGANDNHWKCLNYHALAGVRISQRSSVQYELTACIPWCNQQYLITNDTTESR